MKTYRQKMGFDREEIPPIPAPRPRLFLTKEIHNGKPHIRITVVCNTQLIRITDGLGYSDIADQANHRTILCSSPAALDAARDPISHLFDHRGGYIG